MTRRYTTRTLTESDRRYIESVKDSPNYCKVYAKRTPRIPFHNGTTTCLGCGAAIVWKKGPVRERSPRLTRYG